MHIFEQAPIREFHRVAQHDVFALGALASVTQFRHTSISKCRNPTNGRQGEGLTKPELTPGLLQHTLQDAAQHAGMAGLLCETAGWPYLAMLCNALSKQAAAGGRYELLPLLEVRAVP